MDILVFSPGHMYSIYSKLYVRQGGVLLTTTMVAALKHLSTGSIHRAQP